MQVTATLVMSVDATVPVRWPPSRSDWRGDADRRRKGRARDGRWKLSPLMVDGEVIAALQAHHGARQARDVPPTE